MNKDILIAKLEKLANIKKAGIDPYPEKTNRSFTNNDALKKFSSIKKSIYLVGRIRSMREMGNVSFAHIQDETGKIQIFLSKENIGNEKYKFFIKNIDIGDFIEVKGNLFKTKSGEKTLKVEKWKILSKALKPLPSEWYGFKDEDNRHRYRYLDILFNPDVKEIIQKKAVFWSAVREFHLKNGFMEVETPVLENTTGGADARPFVTHHNALDLDIYLRISAGELWQKRLMVAGFEKTFEIGRIFRNEGISTEHLQDYTQCEAYWAYSNMEEMYKFLQNCYKFVAKKTFGTLKFNIRGFKVDLGKKWPLIDYALEIKNQTKIDIWNATDKEIVKKLNELKINFDSNNIERMIDNLWKYCRKKIAGPAILINHPKKISPLAKSDNKNKDIVKRFQFIIAGSEIGQGYSELNDPIDQKERFQAQQKLRDQGDEEAQMEDAEFIEALEYGMPPTSGHGFSERLFSFLADKSIKECQTFPLTRPK